MGVWAGTAVALVLQKSAGHSHLVSCNETDAREKVSLRSRETTINVVTPPDVVGFI